MATQKETLLDASAACDSITQNQKKVLIYIWEDINTGMGEHKYREIEMKTFLLMTGSGPLMILTSHGAIENSILLDKLLAKGN